ncbi:MAG: thioesterase [Cryomorphaceae bacterium BACL22 MAG-120619-bin32]|jgi:hypothetical protein|nr:MAG: thioesterase [Cryomorphaceae bacterium BACL22 MAG-120619-bin32]
MLFKLLLAYFGGVRVISLSETIAIVKIKHQWINQNPFKSIFWVAQGMAAEMSTGILIMQEIRNSNSKVSMLVTHQESDFSKKATGKILFTCNERELVKKTIEKSIKTNEGQTVILTSIGVNESRVVVSNFRFQWSLKIKNCKFNS